MTRIADVRTGRSIPTDNQANRADDSARSRGADSAGAAGRVGDSRAADKDVFVKDGVLTFADKGSRLSKADKLERAKKLLEVLRAGGDSKLTFGGRVSGGGVDAAASLRAYYPSLDAVEALGEVLPEVMHELREFLDDVSVPDDLRTLLHKAVRLVPPFGPEPAEPLGTMADTNLQVYVGAANGNLPAQLTPTDQVLRDLIMVNNGASWSNRLDAWFSGNRSQPVLLAQVRLYARAKELGVNIQIGNLNAIWPKLPNSDEAAQALWRLAKAFDTAPEQVPFHGGTLATYIAAKQAAPPQQEQGQPGTIPSGPVGTYRCDKNTASNLINQNNDLNLPRCDDETVRNVFSNWGWGDVSEWAPRYVQGAQSDQRKLALVHWFARARELGCTNVFRNNAAVRSLAANMPNHQTSADALRRLCQAYGWPENQIALHGRTLDQWPASGTTSQGGAARRATATPRSRTRAPAGQLGTLRLTGNDQKNLINQHNNNNVDKVDDQTVREMFTPGVFDGPDRWAHSYVNQAQSVERKIGLVWLFARAKELGCTNQLSGRTLGNIVAVMPNQQESADALRRLCAAYGWPETNVTLHGKRLDQWPATTLRRGAKPLDLKEALKTRALGRGNLDTGKIQQMVQAKDPKVFKITDGCLATFRQVYADPYQLSPQSQDRDWHMGLLAAWEHGTDLGHFTLKNIASYTQSYAPQPLLDDPEYMSALVRCVKKSQYQPAQLRLTNGAMLNNHAPFMSAWNKLEQRLQGVDAPLQARRQGEVSITPAPLGADNSIVNTNSRNNYWNARDARIFELSDQSLNNAQWGNGITHVARFLTQFQNNPKVLLLFARLAELSPGLGTNRPATQIAAFLHNVVPHNIATDEAIPFIVRAAKAAGVDLDSVVVQRPDGSNLPVKDHPVYKQLGAGPDKKLKKALKDSLAALDPATGAAGATQREAAVTLLGDAEPRFNFEELLEAGAKGRLNGKLQPASVSRLGADKVKAFADESIGAWDHLGAAAVLGGLFTGLKAADIQAALESKGHDPEQAQLWAERAEALQGLSGKALEFALQPLLEDPSAPDFHGFALRLEVVSKKELKVTWLDEKFETEGAADPIGFCQTLIERAMMERKGSAQQKQLLGYLDKKVEAGELDVEDLKAALSPEAVGLLAPEAEAAVDKAVTGYLKADVGGREEAIDKIAEAVEGSSRYVDPGTLARKALGEIYNADLARVLPLGEADQELGGVAGKALDSEPAFPKGTKTVAIGGIEIPENTRTDKDKRLVPRKSQADLIMTPTTEQNVKLLAGAWRMKRPVLLEGPTSSGKTSAVRYIAHKTGSPYRRINLSYYTDVSDLLGRYVGGEKRYKKADLEQMSENQLRALGLDYKLDELLGESGFAAASKTVLVGHINELQLKPRWVDGPVVKAMKRGEVLLLDEINLARPEVIERLNSLFDDDGNLVLTEHRNEVIKPDDNFRIFATMNPASYAGRARLSKAMRSRWNNVYAHGLNQSDVTQIVKALYGQKIPEVELAKIVAVHDNLARIADEGQIGRQGGGVAFTLRNLFRVCDRFARYQGSGLQDDALMRRETEECYLGGLFDDDDRQHVTDILTAAMPYQGQGFYDDLELKETNDSWQIGDVMIRKLDTGHNLVPGESAQLVMTDRTKQVLYRLAKALDMGENVAMIGERACGKTAVAKLYAMMRGQPYYRQLMSGSTDGMQLIGGYDDQGWKDGLLLDAGRPDGTPGMFLGDELNVASPALLERLNSVLDDERKLVLSEKEGEEIRLHPDFRFVAAFNPPTKGYGGRQKLSKAMQNRFTMMYVPDISEREEYLEIAGTIGKKLGVPEPVIEVLVDLQLWIQQSYENETIGKEVREQDRPEQSIRQLLGALKMISKFTNEMGVEGAYLFAVESYYASLSEAGDGEAIMNKAKEMAQ